MGAVRGVGSRRSSGGSSGSSVTRSRVMTFDHFLSPPTNSNITSNYGDLLIYTAGSGAALSGQSSTESDRPGQVRLTTGTTSGGNVTLYTTTDGVLLGGGAWSQMWGVRPVQLSTSGERYQLLAGFIAAAGIAMQTDGAFFLYDEGGVSNGATASPNWQCVTVKSSSFTRTITDIPVSISTWADLEVRVNAAATSVQFLINGAVVATHTATIPTAASEQVCLGVVHNKSVGSSARQVDLDYYGADWVAA